MPSPPPRRTATLLVIAALVASIGACRPAAAPASPATSSSSPTLASVAWVQTAAEFQALSLQAFAQASAALEAALADPAWVAAPEQASAPAGLPPAVILDVDETVLDNSPYQAWAVRAGRRFEPATWDAWVAEGAAAAVPGALEFTRRAASRGVTVFYVSNRDVSGEAATRKNLERLGFPIAEGVDTVLLKNERQEWGSAKGTRRAEVAARYRVVMLVGDNLGDFTDEYKGDVGARAAVIAGSADRWGSRWIMIPNPMYGSWIDALGQPDDPAAAMSAALRAWGGPG